MHLTFRTKELLAAHFERLVGKVAKAFLKESGCHFLERYRIDGFVVLKFLARYHIDVCSVFFACDVLFDIGSQQWYSQITFRTKELLVAHFERFVWKFTKAFLNESGCNFLARYRIDGFVVLLGFEMPVKYCGSIAEEGVACHTFQFPVMYFERLVGKGLKKISQFVVVHGSRTCCGHLRVGLKVLDNIWIRYKKKVSV